MLKIVDAIARLPRSATLPAVCLSILSLSIPINAMDATGSSPAKATGKGDKLAAAGFPYGKSRPEMRQFFLLDQRAGQHAAIPVKHADTIRAMSFNLNAFQSIDRTQTPKQTREKLIHELQAADADIVALQEVVADHETAAWMEKSFPGWYIARCDTAVHGDTPIGNVLLSRFRLDGIIAIPLPGYHDSRCAIIASVSADQAGILPPITLIATHFDNDDHASAQNEALKIVIADTLKSRTAMLLGDFNAVLRSDPQLPLFEPIERKQHREIPFLKDELLSSAGFHDAPSLLALPTPPWTCWSGKRVDYIYLKNADDHIRPKNSGVIHSDLSDHAPIFFDFTYSHELSKD